MLLDVVWLTLNCLAGDGAADYPDGPSFTADTNSFPAAPQSVDTSHTFVNSRTPTSKVVFNTPDYQAFNKSSEAERGELGKS
jgi:hypothetical protein